MSLLGTKISIEMLAQRHLLILGGAICAGYAFRVVDPGPAISGLVSLCADIMLAGLLLAGGLYVKWSHVLKLNRDVVRLTLIFVPLFITLLMLVGVVAIGFLSLLSAALLAIVIAIGGAPAEHKFVQSTDVPRDVKNLIRLEGPAIAVFALILALSIETIASFPLGPGYYAGYLSLFLPAASFAVGALSALICMRLLRVVDCRKPVALPVAVIGSAALSCLIITLFGGVCLIGVAAVGLIWSEGGRIPEQLRRRAFYRGEKLITPITYTLFGLIFGPHILGADMVVIVFALCAVTLLRVVPRLLALSMSSLSTGEVLFTAWARGAPGVSSALYLLHLYNSPMLIDTEQLLSIGSVCLFWGAVISRLSADYSLTQLLRYHDRLRRVSDRHLW